MSGLFAHSLCAIGAVLVLKGCDLNRPAPSSNGKSSAPSEISQDFMYRGRPIHPAVVEDFVAPLDGSPPNATVVDLEAADHQAGSIPYTVSHEFVRYSDRERHGEGWNGSGYFRYRYLGRTSAGTYVIETAFSGGGSGVFMDLLFVRSRVETSGSRVLLECLGEFGLGDRDDGTVRLERDSVVVSASRYRAQEVIIELR